MSQRGFAKTRLMSLVLAVILFAGCDTCEMHTCGPLCCGPSPCGPMLFGPVGYNARVDNCSTIPPGAIPAPVGTYLHKFIDLQAAKAEADDFVIYNYEWYLGGRDLGPFGRYHLNEIARRLPSVPFPVVVEPSLDYELNEARRQVIIDYLAQYGVPNPQDRVIIAFPQAGGLYGDEAEIRSYLFLLNSFGWGQFGGFGGFGGLGGFGFGGLGFGRFGFGRFGLFGGLGGFGGRGGFFGGGFGGWLPF
ncbi:MAG: hypothetical protein NZM42_12825 [Gemmatales bacterium]|nr:hypothetical protein [Gemmatales bacterium]